jgi:hypothetical protein
MSRKPVCVVGLVLLSAYVVDPAQGVSKPFSVKAFIDQHVCNDAQVGPNQNEQQIGVHVRNISARRRVGLFSFDISALKAAGVVFKNVSLSNLGASAGPINVYGVIESQDNLLPETELTWNNAPGVKNDPAPPVGSPVELDLNDLTDLLLNFTSPADNVRASTAPSQALADFINADTDGIITLLFAPPQDGSSAILRAKENPEPPGGTFLEGILATAVELPVLPSPADKAVDVFRDTVLSWTAGQFATAHDVYFGTILDSVANASRTNSLGVLVAQGQQATTFDPGRLEFGQTYYWRVDEVNAPPAATIFKGPVWSFTVEPSTYAITGITATASSSEVGQGPENTVNGSGLNEAGEHSAAAEAMWLSAFGGPEPVWIQYDFGRMYKLQEMHVWNYNGEFEDIIGFGQKNVAVAYSANGTDWTVLGDFDLAQGTGLDGYASNTTIDFGGVAAQSVKITANSDFGGMGQSGLSEVRFMYIPAQAHNPQPAAGQTGVGVNAVLSWRPGREAASHTVYFSATQQAVADGTAAAGSTNTSSFVPGVLNLAATYYWRVDEANQVQSPSVWAGDVWSFTTADHVVVDDFESYTDEGNLIYQTWVDGYNTTTNGSQVGNSQAPFAEQTTVHGGSQSMPLTFMNVGTAAYSEAKRTFDTSQDWSKSGITTLTLYFYGSTTNKTNEPLWVKLTDQGGKGGSVTYGAGAGESVADLALASWHVWNIPLAGFGVDLTRVKAISIGLGTPGGVSSGNTGIIYVDDIWLGKAAFTE